jgi:hypothetical protein
MSIDISNKLCLNNLNLLSKLRIDYVVIWGHLKHTHTHSYIHDAFYKAFKFIGVPVYKMYSYDGLIRKKFPPNGLFIFEDQAKSNLPLQKDLYYISHNSQMSNLPGIDLSKVIYLDVLSKKAINFSKINDYTFFDNGSRTIFQPWATDLLPHQITQNPYSHKLESKVAYVGYLSNELKPTFLQLYTIFKRNGIELKLYHRISNKKAQRKIQQSLFTFDIRDKNHLDNDYISCRIFKNISYGRNVITNSRYIANFFESAVLPYASSPNDILEIGINLPEIQSLVSVPIRNEVIYKHTYLSRISSLLSVFNA